MRPVNQWSTRAVTMVLAVWVAVSGTALSLWVAAEARVAARFFAAMGESWGATSMEIEVDLLGALPHLVPLYAAVVVLPAAAFWLMWRRAQRRVDGSVSTLS